MGYSRFISDYFPCAFDIFLIRLNTIPFMYSFIYNYDCPYYHLEVSSIIAIIYWMKNCSPSHFSLHGSRANFNRLAFIFVSELEERLQDKRLDYTGGCEIVMASPPYRHHFQSSLFHFLSRWFSDSWCFLHRATTHCH